MYDNEAAEWGDGTEWGMVLFYLFKQTRSMLNFKLKQHTGGRQRHLSETLRGPCRELSLLCTKIPAKARRGLFASASKIGRRPLCASAVVAQARAFRPICAALLYATSGRACVFCARQTLRRQLRALLPLQRQNKKPT